MSSNIGATFPSTGNTETPATESASAKTPPQDFASVLNDTAVLLKPETKKEEEMEEKKETEKTDHADSNAPCDIDHTITIEAALASTHMMDTRTITPKAPTIDSSATNPIPVPLPSPFPSTNQTRAPIPDSENAVITQTNTVANTFSSAPATPLLITTSNESQKPTVFLQVPVNDKQWPAAIRDQITFFIANNMQEAEVILHPAEWGRIKVHTTLQNNAVNLSFTVHTQETKQALHEAMPLLKEALHAQHLTLNSFSLQQESHHADAHTHHENADKKELLATPHHAVKKNIAQSMDHAGNEEGGINFYA